jgi:hypothetical protein
MKIVISFKIIGKIPHTIQNWFKKGRMKANGCKLIHVTFTTPKEMCPPVQIKMCKEYTEN